MTYRQRLERIIAELSAAPGVRVVRAEIVPALGPVAEVWGDDLLLECPDLRLDEAMTALWGEINGAWIEWECPNDGEFYADGPGGFLQISDLLRFARCPFEFDVEDMAPADDAERELLLQSHLIDVRESTHWTSMRVRPGEPLELWYRLTNHTGRLGLDMRLKGDFAGYMELLLRSRGVDRWPLLLLDPSGLSPADRASLLRNDLPMLTRALESLRKIPSAREDAEALAADAEALGRRLGAP